MKQEPSDNHANVHVQACAFVSLLTGATVPTNVAMTGEVCKYGLFVFRFSLCLDHSPGPCHSCRWHQREGARCPSCEYHQGYPAVRQPQRRRPRRAQGDPLPNAVRIRADSRGGSRGGVRQRHARMAAGQHFRGKSAIGFFLHLDCDIYWDCLNWFVVILCCAAVLYM